MAMHFTATTLTSWAADYDEESKHALRLQSLAKFFMKMKDKVMRHRFRYMRLSKSLGLIGASRAAYQELLKGLNFAKAGAIAATKKVIEAEKRRRSSADPYVMWEKSLDKKQLFVTWRDDASPSDLIKLGDVLIDVDVPCKILREKLRRRLREPLNGKNGEGFVFLNKNGEALPKFYEDTQRGRFIMQVQVNAETREVGHQVTLLLDPDTPFTAIPEIEDYVPPPPRKSMVAMPTEGEGVVGADLWEKF